MQQAAWGGHTEVAELLIAKGADVSAMGIEAPLFAAVRRGHKEIVELLIAEGADVNAKGGIGGKTTARMGGIKDQYLV